MMNFLDRTQTDPSGDQISDDTTTPMADSCRDKECYFGAKCIQENGEPTCECIMSCPKDEDSTQVCDNVYTESYYR